MTNYDLAQQACYKRRTLRISYFSQHMDLTYRDIHVYRVNSRYVFAFCRLRNDFRLFLIDRIGSVELVDQEFDLATDFAAIDERMSKESVSVPGHVPERLSFPFTKPARNPLC